MCPMNQKKLKIWIEGKLYRWKKADIHVLTHTFHYGGGVFEGIRFYDTSRGPAVFRLKEHIDRLFYSASCLEMKIPYSRKDIDAAIYSVIAKNKLKSGYIRPIAYYGSEHMGIHPQGLKVHLAIAAWPWGAYLGTEPVKTLISSYIRIHPKSTHADAKICGHYVNSILASMEAVKKGCQEAILLDYKGNVAEGPGENIFIVKNGILITPPPGNILKGITRASVFDIAADIGIKVIEKKITVSALMAADEAFYTGTAAQISAIKSVNGKKIGSGKIGLYTEKMATIFNEIVHGRNRKYQKWLTYLK